MSTQEGTPGMPVVLTTGRTVDETTDIATLTDEDLVAVKLGLERQDTIVERCRQAIPRREAQMEFRRAQVNATDEELTKLARRVYDQGFASASHELEKASKTLNRELRRLEFFKRVEAAADGE